MEPDTSHPVGQRPAPRSFARRLPGHVLGLVILIVVGWGLWQQVPRDSVPRGDLVEVEVADVQQSADRAAHLLVLREVGGHRRLAMAIGEAEALAIAMELAGQRPARPMTHDLLRRAILALDGQLKRVEVTHLQGGTYFARLVIERGQRRIEVDARPSDAIALALRTGAGIYVHSTLLEGATPRVPAATF